MSVEEARRPIGGAGLRAGDLVVTPGGQVAQVLCRVAAVEVVFDDDSTAVLPVESLSGWAPPDSHPVA